MVVVLISIRTRPPTRPRPRLLSNDASSKKWRATAPLKDSPPPLQKPAVSGQQPAASDEKPAASDQQPEA